MHARMMMRAHAWWQRRVYEWVGAAGVRIQYEGGVVNQPIPHTTVVVCAQSRGVAHLFVAWCMAASACRTESVGEVACA